MRAVLVSILALVGCKSTPPAPAHDDAPVVHDAAVDAGPTFTCPGTPTSGSTVGVRKIGAVTGSATLATSPPNDHRLFVLGQQGVIWIFEGEVLRATPFLDISADAGGAVEAGGELGLLGLAFHPQFATNHQFFVFYTRLNPTRPPDVNYLDVVVRYTTSATDPNVADPSSATTILSIPDFASNHNGGMIEFGSDGMLYVGTGDGGSGGDPARNGQNRHALLGKILRLDVDHPSGANAYGIPVDNPYASGVDGAPEVWMYGLRNPWRWSFDRATGDLWIGDVGQSLTEEIDVLFAGQQAGKNLGWSAYEGSTCCQLASDKCQQGGNYQPCDPTGMTAPLDQRTHADNWHAIIGGQVYRGTRFSDLVGWYFYTDNTKHQLVKARLRPDRSLEIVDLPAPVPTGWPTSPAAIHADACGELYLTTTTGAVYAIEAAP
ncbi:MAG: PQQ-dependent sugar dehydrogenase [Proteobacteria bacterium]|nr:PQQ-dependent sugar dehydrogenase [Pseudomonadota bacterium]